MTLQCKIYEFLGRSYRICKIWQVVLPAPIQGCFLNCGKKGTHKFWDFKARIVGTKVEPYVHLGREREIQLKYFCSLQDCFPNEKGSEYKFWDFKAQRAQIMSTNIDS